MRQIRYYGGRPITISPDKAEELIGCNMSNATSEKNEIRRARSKFNITRKKKKS